MTHKGHIGRLFNYLLFISVFLVHLHQLLLSFVVSQLNFMKMCRFDFPRENRVSCGWEKASVVFFFIRNFLSHLQLSWIRTKFVFVASKFYFLFYSFRRPSVVFMWAYIPFKGFLWSFQEIEAFVKWNIFLLTFSSTYRLHFLMQYSIRQ